MVPFDFRKVLNATPFPLTSSPYFLFLVAGEIKARVDTIRGINCGFNALLQLNGKVNEIELILSNDAGPATITAWLDNPPKGLQIGPSQTVPSTLGLQLVRFDVANIARITLESRGELYLQTVS
jgi:hypothetical protein